MTRFQSMTAISLAECEKRTQKRLGAQAVSQSRKIVDPLTGEEITFQDTVTQSAEKKETERSRATETKLAVFDETTARTSDGGFDHFE
jgi:hypothetical protein